jgi:adenosylcobinamide-GDP ribazoletransferase
MVWDGLRLAGTMLTAVPVPGSRAGYGAAHGMPDRRTAAAAMYWAPVIGLVLGTAAAGVLLACRAGHSGPLLAAVLAIAALAALTRGLHLDGLADLADGLGSRQPATRALEIMKQSDIGPFGVATIVLTVLIQVSALARAEQIGRGPVAVAAAAVTARLAIMLACRRTVPSARPDGLGALVAGTVHPLAAGVLVLAALAGASAFGWIYPAAMAIALAVSLALTSLATRRLGGITGDVLGAVAEVTAAACLLVTAFS